MRRLASLVAAALVVAAAPAGRAGADVATLVDSVVAAYGGPAALARLRAVRVEADVDARLRRVTGRVRRDFRAPDRLRVEIAYPRTTEVRVLDGHRGWRGDAGRLQRVTGLPLAAMEYQLLRSGLPWALAEHRDRLEDRGEQTVGGVRYRLVGLPWSDALDVTYWVNAVSRRVERVGAVLRAPGGRTVFGTGYRDFRRVDGVLVPFAEENYASGRHTGTTRVRRVTFAPPDLGPFAPTGRRR